MLNKVSVLDILASVIRRARLIICLMIVFAVAFGCVKYFKNKGVSDDASQKLTSLETDVKTADTAYTNLSDRIKALPISEINAKSTWIGSVIYSFSLAEQDETDEVAHKFCNDLKAKWNATDLSEPTSDLFLKVADDEGVRDLVDLSNSDEKSMALIVKAKNKSQCIAMYYMLNDLILEMIDDEIAATGVDVSLVQNEFVMKKTNDSEISQKQNDYKEKLSKLETEKDKKHTEYDKAVIEANRYRGVRKWAIAGAALVLLVSAAWIVCCACLYEPLLSVAHARRETGLEYLGLAKQRVSLFDRIAARISGERLRNADVEKGKLVDLIKLKTSAEQVTLVTAEDSSNSKNLASLFSRMKEAGFKTESRAENTVIKEKVDSVPAVLVLRKDKTTVREAKQLNSLAADVGYKVEGFVFI